MSDLVSPPLDRPLGNQRRDLRSRHLLIGTRTYRILEGQPPPDRARQTGELSLFFRGLLRRLNRSTCISR
jgi:hypothetical protein